MADLFGHMATTGAVLKTMEETPDYSPLPIRNLVVGAPVSFNVFLKIKAKGQTSSNFIQCCAAGDEFQQEWIHKLNRLKIPHIYFATGESGEVTAYLQHHLELALADQSQSVVEKATKAADAAQIWNLQFFSSEKARTGEQIKMALGFLEPMYEAVHKDRSNMLVLLGIRRQGLRLYTHCLQVSTLGMAFTHYLGWSANKTRDFGLGCLIHDIGMSRVPQPILDKPEELTEEEMDIVKRHPMEGFRLLQKLTQLRFEALQMIRQHHENGDGDGYPDGLKLHQTHLWARILRIVDTYDAMTSERPYRPAMDPKKALWTMSEIWQQNKTFDGNLLKSFFRFLAK